MAERFVIVHRVTPTADLELQPDLTMPWRQKIHDAGPNGWSFGAWPNRLALSINELGP